MASLGNYLPSPGSSVWRRDVRTPSDARARSDSRRVRHVVIRDAEIWEEPAPYVVYRIDVLTEHDHWYLFRRYSQFHSLHKKLVRQHGVNKDLLPPKRVSGNLSKPLIDTRRKLLEKYLQKLIHNEPRVSHSPELCVFLDVPTHNVVKVADLLTRHLYLHGDKLLEQVTPIALSVNEMYAITHRLHLPRDALGMDSDDVAADPAHLYSFVHQLHQLRISLPPIPCSVSCMTFDLAPFKSLHTLKLDRVPLSQVGGLLLIQRQLQKLTVQNSLQTLSELLVDAVEEKRNATPQGSGGVDVAHPFNESGDAWRLTATAKLAGNRIVVQPWHQLHILVVSHNNLTSLDNSLQLLPVLRELNLSYNKLQEIDLQFLCLPSLEKLNLSHNNIHTIHQNRKVLERITHLTLSHNKLTSLSGIDAFVGLCVLSLSFNLLSSSADLGNLVRLKRLNTLGLQGNPITSSSACRLVLLAKFLKKSRPIILDDLEPSNKEQAKIKSYFSKYGSDPDSWPVAKPLAHLESSIARQVQHHVQPERLAPTTPTSPCVDLSFEIQQGRSGSVSSSPQPSTNHIYTTGNSTPSPGNTKRSERHLYSSSCDNFSFPSSSNVSSSEHSIAGSMGGGNKFMTPQPPRSSRGHNKRPHSASTVESEEKYSVGVSLRGGVKNVTADRPSRQEPDGQSDISSASPDFLLHRPSRSGSTLLSPPPCTPVNRATPPSRDADVSITPEMIQSALLALEGIEDKDAPISYPRQRHHSPATPPHSQVLTEALTNALTVWISSQSLQGVESSSAHTPTSVKVTPPVTPPPSTQSLTPGRLSQEAEPGRHGISAGDLITALSTLKVSGGHRGHSPRHVTVPSGSPMEGMQEWVRLGIKPEEVIHALSALTIQQDEDDHRSCDQGDRSCDQDDVEEIDSGHSPYDQGDTPPDHSGYTCLFPETKASTTPYDDEGVDSGGNGGGGYHGDEGVDSGGNGGGGYHGDEGVDSGGNGGGGNYHGDEEELVDHSRVHAHSAINELAELDPFLTTFDPPPVASLSDEEPISVLTGEAEIGVDTMEAGREISLDDEKGEGPSNSPPESVLYSQ